MKDPQLRARDFWIQVAHPELNDTLTYPGTFFRMSEQASRTPCKPPLIGEHNQEIYRQSGISDEEIIRLKQAGVI